MRTETVTVTYYTFEELSDKAKERARDWWKELSSNDNEFADMVIEDAANIAALMGLDIRRNKVNKMDGGIMWTPSVEWSGFSCQGDGACFKGIYAGTIKNAFDRVREYAPKDERLHTIAAKLDELQLKYDGGVRSAISLTSSRYCHSGIMTTDTKVVRIEDSYSYEDDADSELEDEFRSIMREFANWIYKQLEHEYNFVMSNENVDESIISNGYEFDINGNRLC